MNQICLSGMTWNHSRALPPLVAASQRFEELHPGIRITWERRTLDEFGHAGLVALANSYDLLIIDHPMLGDAHRRRVLIDLLPQLPLESLAKLEADALGACLESYRYESCLYALPIDAAAPAASFRPDLLERGGHRVPTCWQQVVELARLGLVRMPAFAADLFLNLMGMCVSRGSRIALADTLFDHDIAVCCLEEMRELTSFMPDSIYGMNPIGIYETMAAGDDIAYCPFAYTYNNYSRSGFAANLLLFTNPVPLGDGMPLRTVLGGTGIAVSAECVNTEAAIDFCLFAAGVSCQSHIYGMCGGQPASREAWRNSLLNQLSNNFFENTVASIQAAHIRPRYPGYIALQRAAGVPIASFLRGESAATQTLERLDNLYRRSLAEAEGDREVER